MRMAQLESLAPIWQIRCVTPAILIGIFVFLFGLIIGSFLNVCILRIPGRQIHRHARVRLPKMRRADSPLRQHSRPQLFIPARKMPLLQNTNLADVSAR